MALNWISARAAASVLPFIGIALALANWNARPDAAWAWLAAIIMFVVMAAVRRHWQLAVRHSGRRMTMIILGAYLVVTGNALPKQFATASSMQCAGAQVQAFQRFAGWTWALCGLGFATWGLTPNCA